MASLGNDLANIRKEQNLSLDDVNEATKIPKRILQSIEDDSIFTDLEENPTYIRSYIRGYAKALSIDENRIIHALNKREKNEYSGSLRKESAPDPKKTFEYDSGDEDTSHEDDMIHDHSPEFQSKNEKRGSGEPESPQAPVPDISVKRSKVRSVDWADLGRQFQPLKSTSSRAWIGIIVVLIVVAGGIAFYFYNSGSSEDANNQSPTTSQEASSASAVSTDSLQLDIATSADDETTDLAADTETSNELKNKNLETLPDTLTMVLYAAYGKLEPVRVYTDIMDNINPYWIEQGEALRFNFVNEIRIRGQFSRMDLLVNGHVVQNIREQFYNPETRLLEINRSFFEGDSKWLRPSPDSLGIDVPPPTIIKERPTFN